MILMVLINTILMILMDIYSMSSTLLYIGVENWKESPNTIILMFLKGLLILNS